MPVVLFEVGNPEDHFSCCGSYDEIFVYLFQVVSMERMLMTSRCPYILELL